MKLTKRLRESYFRNASVAGNLKDYGCLPWSGAMLVGCKQVPILLLGKKIYVEAVRVGLACMTGNLDFDSAYRRTCLLDDCVNPYHVTFYEPNRSGRRPVAFEDRPGYTAQWSEIRNLVYCFPNMKAKEVLARLRAQGGHIKGTTFSEIYHKVRAELGLSADSVGRGRKKVTFEE